MDNKKSDSFVPKVADIKPYLQPGSRLYYDTHINSFRDFFGQRIHMGDLGTPPLLDDQTRDDFSSVVPNAQDFWGYYCN